MASWRGPPVGTKHRDLRSYAEGSSTDSLSPLVRLLARQAAKEMVAVRRIGMGDDQGPSSEDGDPADV